MTTLTAELQTVNRHINDLQHRIDIEQTKVDCLIVAHKDPHMIQRLVDAMPEQEVAVLPLDQSAWNRNLTEIIAWTVDAGIDRVMIVGHSDATQAVSIQVNPRNETAQETDAARSTECLLNGVRHSQEQLVEAKTQFTNHLNQLLSSEELQDKECSDNFSLQTLFFISNGGVFLDYCATDGSFTPLV